ncbi:MAG: hypothetical protein HFI34_03610 [Lachnospiraceae bacterium]|nr:hypothetical protein [Lachnospiraceae bacterium]
MGLQLILGGSGTGKSFMMYQNVVRKSMDCPDESFMAIVPEQFTMETQKTIVQLSPRKGTMSIDILSFERLAKRIFEEAGLCSLRVLDDTGKCLILRKIIEENKERLSVFGSKVKMAGFIEEMKSVISELCQYGIGEEELKEILKRSETRPLLYAKCQDILLIQTELRKFLKDRFIMNEELLTRACELIPHSRMVRNCHITFDEYTGFSPVQYQVIGALLKYAKSVTVTLTIRDAGPAHLQSEKEQDIFLLTIKTVNRLKKLAQEYGAEVHNDLILTEPKRFSVTDDLAALEQNIFRFGKQQNVSGKRRRNESHENQSIAIAVSTGPVQEADYVASSIKSLVREQNIRYREIAVLTADIEGYHRVLAEAFEQHDIPCFIDYKRSITANPMVETIRAVLEIITENFSYESVFRYLRCYMSSLTREEIDILENHVLERGIRGYKRWCGNFKTEDERILQARDKLLEDTGFLYQTLKRKKSGKPITVKEAVTAIYEFGVRLNLEGKVLERKEQFVREGKMSLAGEYAQTYGKIMELFDKTVFLIGEEQIQIQELVSILDAGFEEIKVGVVPPALDRVSVGDIERTRLKDIRVLFLIGVNDGLIPKVSGRKGILTQAERSFLAESGVELSPTAREDAFIQKFYLYRMLTKPSEKLFLSYKRISGDGSSCRPSYLIGHICKLFPDIKIWEQEKEEQKTPILKITNQATAYRYVSENIYEYMDGQKSEMFREIYRELAGRETDFNSLIEAACFEQGETTMSSIAATMLYGSSLYNSVSRLEEFAQCAYKHFVDYGLQLVERKGFEVEYTDIGNIYHEAIDIFSKKLEENHLSWKEIGDRQREDLIAESLKEIEAKYADSAIYDSARNRYMFERIKNITDKTIWVLQQQVKQGNFVPGGFEVKFASERGLPELSHVYGNHQRMELHGKIDRIDYYHSGDDIYIKIVDYKSGLKKFNINDVYHHLQLQLVVYMKAALALTRKRFPGKNVYPAGMLYYNIDNPVIESSGGQESVNIGDALDAAGELTEEKESPADIEEKEEYIKELCPNGLLSSGENILEALDVRIGERGSTAYASPVIPVTVNKNGSLSESSACVEPGDFENLLDYVHREVGEIGKRIMEGCIEVNPYVRTKAGGTPDTASAPCMYCKYKSVCGFDRNIAGYEYRKLSNPGKDQVWSVIRERAGRKEKNHHAHVDNTAEEGN